MSLSDMSALFICSMFRCELKPSMSVTLWSSPHSSCSHMTWNRTISSKMPIANPSVMPWMYRSCRTDRYLSHKNLCTSPNRTSSRSNRPRRWAMVRARAPLVRNSDGCGSSTVLANRLTASSADVRFMLSGCRRSNICISDMLCRRARSCGGHISSHVPTMFFLPDLLCRCCWFCCCPGPCCGADGPVGCWANGAASADKPAAFGA
mmetsp:Transcript_12255/g.34821  ORF Transcript_12255/g.34821 Transcript_12255/m.34821 type:complete len:206 (-) Transcript_12255:313-930(-)